MEETTQAISTFDLSVNNGNFNVTIEGVVGENAHIEIYGKGVEPVMWEGEWYWMRDFLDAKEVADAKFPMIEVSGTNYFKAYATSGMKIVIWDSTPDNHTARAIYVCEIPAVIEGKVEQAFPTPVEGEGHQQKLDKFEVSLNNDDWNITMAGIVSAKGWLGLYQGDATVKSDGSGSTNYISLYSFSPAPQTFHRETVVLGNLNGSTWLNTPAQSGCRFVIWDILFPFEFTVKPRFILHIPHIIGTIKTDHYGQ